LDVEGPAKPPFAGPEWFHAPLTPNANGHLIRKIHDF